MSVYDRHLNKNTAKFVALSPMSFVERGAEVFEDRFFKRTSSVSVARRTWQKAAPYARGLAFAGA